MIIPSLLAGVAGEYFVAAELSRLVITQILPREFFSLPNGHNRAENWVHLFD